ncbi:MAG: glycoside hydrolase family 38 C-terminal domain-containing protein, partial [Spirochaetales bacterium]|nr:glycoside hydrolase family 38 C-terminal domain-containing protein [Spirochaetales bacterium]
MKKEIFLVPYAHLDTQWRWEYPTTIGKYIKRTLTENLKHFDRFSDYQFTFTGAIRYQMMKDYYPEDFARLKEYVRQGRWHLAGTCMDETDALIPCVESMVRNVLYGDRWQAKEFGRSSRDYMIPDCFGFPGNMPTVLLHCGIRGFSTQKLTWHSAAGIPFGIGIWKGKDGSELPSALDPCAYVSKVKSPFFLNRQRLKRLKAQIKTTGIGKSFQYFGVGDIGGAPGTGSVKAARAAAAKSPLKGDITIRQGSPDQFFRTLTPQEKEKLQRYEGDLLLTLHSAGTLTSAAVMKRWNRKNEQLAFAAEAAACAAWFQAGQAYPADKIRKAWRLVLGSQMHDILPGTSTPDAYTYAHNDEVLALNLWSSILEDAAAALAPLAGGEGDILLYNPCELSRKDPVRVDLSGREAYRGLKGECLLTDPEGREYGGQVVTDEKGRQILCFIPALEPFSWTRFSLHRDRTTVSSPVSLRKRESGYLLENECYRVLVTLEGAVSSIYHKDLDREILSRPPAYELQKEVPGIFPAWNMDWKDRQKPPFVRMEAGGTVSVAEEGPRRCTLRIETPCASSRFLREISLSAGSEIVEFCETIDWNETGCSLKLAFTGAMETGRFTTNWESSREVRDVNHEKIYEMPSRYWADLSSGEDWGFSILEDSKYGYDHPAADTLRMTLLYTPGLKRSDPFRDQSSQDRGRHTIRYALYGHPGDWRQGSDVQARRFNQPVRPFLLSPGSARQPGRHTPLFRLDTE